MSSSSEVVNLITPPSSPDIEEPEPGSSAGVKKEKRSEATDDPMYDSDDPIEVQPVPKMPRLQQQEAGASSSCAATDDDCVVTGASGEHPLVDYAHARWNCCAVPMKTNSLNFCPKCHCVICDKPANQCPSWSDHCSADPLDPQVRQQRTLFQKTGVYTAKTCHLKQLTQVYPTELDVKLNHAVLKDYQRQALSFMVTNERDGFQTNRLIVPYGRSHPLPNIIHGGVLALEMGMGKTMCAIALCKERQIPTLVVAPPLCCVQWVSQTQKYAPELSVAMLYCESQSRIEQSLLQRDIIVVNATSSLLDSIAKRVERVIVDESHETLTAKHSGGAMKFLHNLADYPNVKHVWLVSGTPFGISEKINDWAFHPQMRTLLGRKLAGWAFSDNATTADVKGLVMRMEKKQTHETAQGTKTFMSIPDIEYKTLSVGLNAKERELYALAACIDGWKEKPFSLEDKKNADQIASDLEARFTLRRLVLGERIREFQTLAKKELDEKFYNPDSEAPDRFFAIVDRMTYRIEECCKALLDSSSKIDAVLEEIASLRKVEPTFKAVVITESDGAGLYMKKKLGDRVGVMQRPKGRTSVREQRELLKFQTGQYDILVCSFESVRIGTNLDQACAIYFVDSSINDTEHKQACARISRCGTKHDTLTATFVYVKGTLSEHIYEYHEDRRNGKTVEEAAARFEKDDPHDFTDPHDFHRWQSGRPFDGMKFESTRLPDKILTDLFTSDMSIDHMFEAVCDSKRNVDEYEISMTFAANHRPAMYDIAKQINVFAKDSSLRLAFNIPDQQVDASTEEKLSVRIALSDDEAEVLSTIGNWHKNLASVPVVIRMVLKGGTEMDLYSQISIIKASCSCCKWCGWRQVHDYTVPFVGCHPIMTDVGTQEIISNEKLSVVESMQGTLMSRILRDSNRMYGGMGFAPMTDLFRQACKLAKKDKKRMGVVPFKLLYSELSHNYFASKPNVYQKVTVKLTEEANIDDTIRFEYKGQQYEAFIRETMFTGLDWYAVAYVVESEKPTNVIIVDSHTFVDIKRVAKVGNDAVSIKDIIRLVRDDASKTTKLKEIMLRRDISDAEKLQLATELL